MISSLMSEWLPTEGAPMQFNADGDSTTVTVGDTGTIRTQRVRDQEGNGRSTEWLDSDMPREFETKSGATGAFVWAA